MFFFKKPYLKYGFICAAAFIILFSNPAFAQNQANQKDNKPEKVKFIEITWLDIAFSNYYPIPGTRLADFSNANFGGGLRLNFMLFGFKPLWVFASLLADANLTNSIRLDSIVDLNIAIGAGWRFKLAERLFLTPKISYGIMFHFAYGDYYNAPDIYPGDPRAGTKNNHIFTDQYLHYEVELAVDISPASRNVECELFISPTFIHFIEQHRQGLELGYLLGVRFKMSPAGYVKLEEKIKVKPALLAGQVIDDETKAIFKNVMPVLSDKKAETSSTSGDETFAYLIEPGRDIMLRAEKEGYDTLDFKVDGSTLISGKKKIVILPLKKTQIWGLTGFVHDKNTLDPINRASIIISYTPEKDSKEKKDTELTDRLGYFKKEIMKDTRYDILIKKKGYFTIRSEFSTKGKKPGLYDIKEFLWNAEFQKAEVGVTMEFGNIYFDSGSWTIRKDSIPGLDRMAQFLLDNPKIKVELGAHTDTMGDAVSNQQLSQKRAQSTVEYLIEKGIPAENISARGYGKSKIKNRCTDGVACSAEEHQANRRTELRVQEILPE